MEARTQRWWSRERQVWEGEIASGTDPQTRECVVERLRAVRDAARRAQDAGKGGIAAARATRNGLQEAAVKPPRGPAGASTG